MHSSIYNIIPNLPVCLWNMYLTLAMCIVKGPRKCSVKYGAIWICDALIINKPEINR